MPLGVERLSFRRFAGRPLLGVAGRAGAADGPPEFAFESLLKK
jgi:hypothetical protein